MAMLCADNLWPAPGKSVSPFCGLARLSCVSLSILLVCNFTGCDRMGSSRYAQLMHDADNKSAKGDFERAINLYDDALEDSESTRNAEDHYKLAVLYDDKLNHHVRAIHHFTRCLA